VSWEPGWKTKTEPAGTVDAKELFASAAALAKTADSTEKIMKAAAEYEKILMADPSNYDALVKASEFLYLNSYLYETDKEKKAEYYMKTIQYCERAMYTSPAFKKLADEGKQVWESLSALSPREMSAMFFWYVAAGQYWTECLNPVSKLVNIRLMGRAKAVLKRMTAIDPDARHGEIHMLWGATYAILPVIMGGDMKTAGDEFAKALKLDPDFINNYYLRAKYIHIKNGNRGAFEKDLQHVLSHDITKGNFPYHWGAAYQFKARELLAKKGELF